MLNFKNGVNIVSGFTNTNKTLLFHSFQYLFSIDSMIDIKHAITALNSDVVSATFTKTNGEEFTLKRYFSNSFKAYIDNTEFNNLKFYKKMLSDKFSFNEVVVKNGTRANQFFLKNYIEIINIPEEQLTSTANIFDRKGYSEKGKMIEFFKYLVTGIQSSPSIIKESASIAKSEKTINSIETTFNRMYKRISKKQLNDFDKLIKSKDDLISKLNNIKLELQNNKDELLKLKRNREKLIILKNSYKNDLEDFDFSNIYDQISGDKTNEESDIEIEYYSGLNQSIKDIDEILAFYNKKISCVEEKVNKISHYADKCKEEIDKYTKEIKSLNVISSYKKAIEVRDNLNQKNEEIRKKVDNDILETEKTRDKIYHTNIEKLCLAISNRIKKWGLPNFTNVEFDFKNCNFLFDSKTLKATPKGYKSILTLATNCEILLLTKEIGINTPNFIIIDSLWLASYLKEINMEQLKINIVSNLQQSNIQIVILENEIDKKRLNNCNYICL